MGSYRRGLLDLSRYSRGWALLRTGKRYRPACQVSTRYFTSPCSGNIPQIQLMWWIGDRLRWTDGTFEEGPVYIVDCRDQVLRRKTVRLVRVLWRHCGVEESTWEREDTMRATYSFLFRDEGTWFSRLRFK